MSRGKHRAWSPPPEPRPDPVAPPIVEEVPGTLEEGGAPIKLGEEIDGFEHPQDAVDLPAEPPAPVHSSPRGVYRVTGPGSILKGGRFHGPGDVITLGDVDAMAFADRIERI